MLNYKGDTKIIMKNINRANLQFTLQPLPYWYGVLSMLLKVSNN